MTLPPRWRKAVLTTHVVTSVGWLGAVGAYIALDLVASLSGEADRVRAAHLAMEVTATSVIVPLAIASVVIGIINALSTSWGLFRHYWVVVKLLLTLVATTVLLLEVPTIRMLAGSAADGVDPGALPGTLPHSVGGALVLLLITVLSIYKPRGETPYGWRRRQGSAGRSAARTA
ncbi:hypothetical protein [Blastococcus sp. PRF04-17]|uniref:hypothetical protein n=1 Tax=Blastococcus sp. PRF04-17 TaxID=2933797 RepID=UPI001FF6D4E7|nr:hypothetical protein [Blastococcus sp. PRF04-17]UOY03088.1 hypothetical protein MVA48_06990 [Blastococcus sp. PRF04-17]